MSIFEPASSETLQALGLGDLPPSTLDLLYGSVIQQNEGDNVGVVFTDDQVVKLADFVKRQIQLNDTALLEISAVLMAGPAVDIEAYKTATTKLKEWIQTTHTHIANMASANNRIRRGLFSYRAPSKPTGVITEE